MGVVGLGLTEVPSAEGIFASLLDGLQVFGLFVLVDHGRCGICVEGLGGWGWIGAGAGKWNGKHPPWKLSPGWREWPVWLFGSYT